MSARTTAEALRAIADAVEAGLPAPANIWVRSGGWAYMQFSSDRTAAVDAWAAVLDATAALSGKTYMGTRPWREYTTGPVRWHGIAEVWCAVTVESTEDGAR